MSRPEMPYLAAGAVAVIGGAVKEKAFPANGVLSITATIFLVIVTSMTTGTKIAPLVHAIGMLFFMGVVYALYLKKTVTPTVVAAPTTGSQGKSGFTTPAPSNTGGAGGGGGGSW